MLAVAGRLCDRLGARPVLVAGSILGAAGLLLAAFAPNVGLLIAGAVHRRHRRRRACPSPG